MAQKLSLEVVETAEELKELLHKQKEVRRKERAQALYLLKMGQVTELKELARIVGRDPSTLYRWFERYKARGLASLLELGYANGGSSVSAPRGSAGRLRGAFTGPGRVGQLWGDSKVVTGRIWARSEVQDDTPHCALSTER